MTSHIRALLCAATFLMTVSMAAQAVKTITIVTPPEGPLETQKASGYNLVFEAKTDTGVPAVSQSITVTVRAGFDAVVKKKGEPDTELRRTASVDTGSDGRAEVTLVTKTKPDVVLDVASGETSEVFAWRRITKFSVDQETGPLTKRTVYPKALVITAKGGTKSDEPASFQKMRVRVVGDSDARVFVNAQGPRESKVNLVTDATGKATISLEAGEDLELEFLAIPLNAAGEEIQLGEQTVELSGELEFEESLFSRRVFTELFIGSTFTNDYVETETGDPPVKTKKSVGFSEAAPTARVTFDTIWPGNVTDDEGTGMATEDDPTGNAKKTEDDPGKAKKTKDDPIDKGKPPAKANMFRGSLVHSGINMQFASFPFGKGLGKDPNKEKGFDDAFTGSLYVLWQPDYGIFRSYTPTSTRPGVKFDAIRIGVLALAGMTTRATVDTDGDTTIRRTQLGFKFTHHQTKKGSPKLDQENTVPIRFIEITWGHFEQYGTTLDGKPRKGANRIMIDAGVRLPGMGGNLVPFYAGIHFNGGPGTDDLRIFGGFLFKVNEIARAFQRTSLENRP